MRTFIIAATLAAAFTLTPAFAGHEGRAVAQGNPVWQNPQVDQMPYHSQEYSAPIDPSFMPQQHVYRPPNVTTVCTRGVGKSKGSFFCN